MEGERGKGIDAAEDEEVDVDALSVDPGVEEEKVTDPKFPVDFFGTALGSDWRVMGRNCPRIAFLVIFATCVAVKKSGRVEGNMVKVAISSGLLVRSGREKPAMPIHAFPKNRQSRKSAR